MFVVAETYQEQSKGPFVLEHSVLDKLEPDAIEMGFGLRHD